MNTAPSCVFLFLASRWEKLKRRSQRLLSCPSEIKEKQNFVELHNEILQILVHWNSSYSVASGFQRILTHSAVCSPSYRYSYYFYYLLCWLPVFLYHLYFWWISGAYLALCTQQQRAGHLNTVIMKYKKRHIRFTAGRYVFISVWVESMATHPLPLCTLNQVFSYTHGQLPELHQSMLSCK